MRIFLEIRGGALQGISVEKDCGPITFIVCDRDNLEATSEEDMPGATADMLDGWTYDDVTTEEMDAILEEFDEDAAAEVAAGQLTDDERQGLLGNGGAV